MCRSRTARQQGDAREDYVRRGGGKDRWENTKTREERLREYIADGVNELLDGKRKKRKSDLRFYGEWLLLGAALVALFTLLAVRALADGGPPETELPAASWTASAVIVPAPSSPPVPAETPAAETQPALESRYAPITGDDFELLARVVYAESNTESLEGQQAVAEVVLNRRAAERTSPTRSATCSISRAVRDGVHARAG